MRDFHKLGIWERSHQFTLKVYDATKSFPQSELFGLTSQIRRASSSIPTNIAEGCGRATNKDFAHFLEISLGSSFEVETQLVIAKDLGYDKEGIISGLLDKIQRIEKQINQLIRKIRPIANSQ